MENVLSTLFCLSLFFVSVTNRVKSYVSVLILQGVILSLILVIPYLSPLSLYSLILPFTILVFKVFLIPGYINRMLITLDVNRKIEPAIQQMIFLPLVISTIIIIFLVSSLLSKTTDIEVIPFASGLSAIVTGIYIIIFRKKLIVHVCGFLIMENGIFLFGIAVASEIPMLIELGTLLDIFVVVFLMGIALNRIRSTFAGFEVTDLRRLKD